MANSLSPYLGKCGAELNKGCLYAGSGKKNYLQTGRDFCAFFSGHQASVETV